MAPHQGHAREPLRGAAPVRVCRLHRGERPRGLLGDVPAWPAADCGHGRRAPHRHHLHRDGPGALPPVAPVHRRLRPAAHRALGRPGPWRRLAVLPLRRLRRRPGRRHRRLVRDKEELSGGSLPAVAPCGLVRDGMRVRPHRVVPRPFHRRAFAALRAPAPQPPVRHGRAVQHPVGRPPDAGPLVARGMGRPELARLYRLRPQAPALAHGPPQPFPRAARAHGIRAGRHQLAARRDVRGGHRQPAPARLLRPVRARLQTSGTAAARNGHRDPRHGNAPARPARPASGGHGMAGLGRRHPGPGTGTASLPMRSGHETGRKRMDAPGGGLAVLAGPAR